MVNDEKIWLIVFILVEISVTFIQNEIWRALKVKTENFMNAQRLREESKNRRFLAEIFGHAVIAVYGPKKISNDSMISFFFAYVKEQAVSLQLWYDMLKIEN